MPPPDLASATNPIETEGLLLDHPQVTAGGIPAITNALRHAIGEAGTVRGIKLLRELNQFEGFDCPGCAWPDPDTHRSITEFCENGAKAVAEAGTLKRVTPEFFREWSVADLSRQSDHWLGKAGRLTHPMVLRHGASH